MINLNDVIEENTKQQNLNLPKTPGQPHRIL